MQKLIGNNLILLAVLLSVCIASSPAMAWDSVGHRLTAYVAYLNLSPDTRQLMSQLLSDHPRYQEDFLQQMPASVAAQSESAQLPWLLSQAAIWPDLVRRLPEDEREKYNHPNWHWIDGAWIMGEAIQGNSYVGMQSLDDIEGKALDRSSGRVSDLQVTNVMLGLEFATYVMSSDAHSNSAKAVALCWLLHLIGDIHQPLHVGTLYSTSLFTEGDRGGNLTPTSEGSLHQRWDQALSAQPFNLSLQTLLTQKSTDASIIEKARLLNGATWMQESRELLLQWVYTDEMKANVLTAETNGSKLPRITLDQDYIARMEEIAREQITLAGLRIANVLEAR